MDNSNPRRVCTVAEAKARLSEIFRLILRLVKEEGPNVLTPGNPSSSYLSISGNPWHRRRD